MGVATFIKEMGVASLVFQTKIMEVMKMVVFQTMVKGLVAKDVVARGVEGVANKMMEGVANNVAVAVGVANKIQGGMGSTM